MSSRPSGSIPSGRAVCPGRSTVITLEQIEAAVETRLLQFLQSYRKVEVQVQRKRTSVINRLEMEITAREEEIAQLGQNLALIREPDVVHIIAGQIHTANERLSALREEYDNLLYQRGPTDLEPYFEAVLSEWSGYTIEEKKKIAQAAIGRVAVDDERIEVVFRAEYGDCQTKK